MWFHISYHCWHLQKYNLLAGYVAQFCNYISEARFHSLYFVQHIGTLNAKEHIRIHFSTKPDCAKVYNDT